MIPLICFHADCPDGYGSAWWLGRHLGEHEKVACYYDRPFPDCAGRDVYSVDFCPKADVLRRVCGEADSLLVLDHHASQVEEVRQTNQIALFSAVVGLVEHHFEGGFVRFTAVMDMEHSGVGLISQFVRGRGGPPPPDWFRNIEDRDLWRFNVRRTQDVFAAVTARPYTDEAWDAMGMMGTLELAQEGVGIEMYRQRLIEATLETAFLAYVGGYLVWCAASPYAICSDVAGELAKREPDLFGATYVQYGDHKKYSLRSTPEGLDVSKVAQSMDPTGGGHVHAAGARVEEG